MSNTSIANFYKSSTHDYASFFNNYEVSTKERVIALAIQMSNTPIDEGVMNHYMEEYTNVYIEYERAKEHFYNDVVVNLMQDGDMSWELNFEAKAVTFYA